MKCARVEGLGTWIEEWRVRRGSEQWERRRKGGKIHCHCQNKFSFWNPLKISFEAKLLEKCKRRTKKLNKNTQKIRKNWRRRRRPSREAKKSKEERSEEEREGAEEELSWATAAEKTGKNWKYYKTFVIISVAFIVGALLLSLSLSIFPCPLSTTFNTGQLFSIYSPILQLLESGEKVKFLSPNRHQCGTPRGRRFANKPKQKPNTQHYTTYTTTHTTTHTGQHKQGTHTGTNRSTNTWLPAQLLRQQNLNPTLLYPDHNDTSIAVCAMSAMSAMSVCVDIWMVFGLWINHRLRKVGWMCG